MAVVILVAGGAFTQEPGIGLADVRSIRIGNLGDSEESEEFREALGIQLQTVGFEIVDPGGNADALLTGAIHRHTSKKGVLFILESAVLKNAQGETLWHKKFGRRQSYDRQGKTIARSLQAAWKHAVWEKERFGL